MGRLGNDSHIYKTRDYVNDKAIRNLRLFPKGSVLFTKSGASTLLNQRAILGCDMYVVSHIAATIPNESILSGWLYYWLRTVDFNKLAHATTLPSLPLSKAKQIPIPLAPFDQQKLIVDEIEKQFSRLDEAVAGLKRIKANLKRYKATVLKAAVEGKLTEEWRKAHPNVETGAELLKSILIERKKKWEEKNLGKKYKEPVAPDTSNLPELPEGWVWATAEQISDFITKGTTPAASKLAAGNGEIQFLKVYNLTFDGKLNHKFKPAFVSRETHEGELARSVVYSGDVLINIVGPPLGQVSIVPPDLPEANINQAIARFRPLDGVLKQYLVFALMAKDVMGWATKRAKTTAGQANLTLELCRALPVPLPPFVEQKEIENEVARALSVADESETIIDANLKRAERLRQSILKKAFSGSLVN
jgi:type I restriction enzyme S subunit